MAEIILSLIAGLVLFLHAVHQLSTTIQAAVGDRAAVWIKRYTSNAISGVIVGAVITAILGSSSAVIIITIVFVNANLLAFKNAMGIVLGANIGTSVSSQIIALDVGKFSPVFLLIGFVLLFVPKVPKASDTGRVVFYFGLLFFGLYFMESAVEPMKDEAYFTNWMEKTENHLLVAVIGAMVTLVIQSSSATVGIALILAKKELLTLTGAIAVMLGAELGTCSDTLLATIRGSRQALKTGLFHLSFNLISIILGLLLFAPFVDLVKIFSAGSSIERTVANGHMLFNLLGVLIFVWTIPLFEKALNRIVPENPDDARVFA